MDVDGITHDVDYYPGFSLILDEDIQLIRDGVTPGDINRAFMYLDDSDGVASSPISIGDYYNAVGHTLATFPHMRLSALKWGA